MGKTLGVAFSSDGTLVVILRSDPSRLILWRRIRRSYLAETDPTLKGSINPYSLESEPRIIDLKGEDFRTVALSGDDRTVALGGNRALELFDLGTEKYLPALEHESIDVSSVAFSPDGKKLAGTSMGRLYLWDVKSRKARPIDTGSGPTDVSNSTSSIAFTRDGTRLGVATDGRVLLLDVSKYSVLAELKDVRFAGPLSLSFSADGSRLALGGFRQAIVLDGKTLKIVKLLPASAGTEAVAYLPSGDLLALSSPPVIRLLDADSDDTLATIKTSYQYSGPLLFSPDGQALYFYDYLFDTRPWTELAPLDTDSASWTTFLNGSDSFTSVNQEGWLKVWSATTRTPIGPPVRLSSGSAHIAATRDGRLFAGGSLADIYLSDEFGNSLGSTRINYGVNSLSFSPDGRSLAFARSENESTACGVMDVATKSVRILQGGLGLPEAVQYSPDGRWIAAAGGGNGIVLWPADAREDRTPFLLAFSIWSKLSSRTANNTHSFSDITDLIFSPDSRMLVTMTASDGAEVWDIQTRRRITELKGEKGDFAKIAFSADGRTLANAGNGAIRTWDVSTWKPFLTIKTTSRRINSLAFSPDGRHLALAGEHGLHLY